MKRFMGPLGLGMMMGAIGTSIYMNMMPKMKKSKPKMMSPYTQNNQSVK